jgi:hypothetical protein
VIVFGYFFPNCICLTLNFAERFLLRNVFFLLRNGVFAERFFCGTFFLAELICLRTVFSVLRNGFVAERVLLNCFVAKRFFSGTFLFCGTGLLRNVFLRNGSFAERVFCGTDFAERVLRNVFFLRNGFVSPQACLRMGEDPEDFIPILKTSYVLLYSYRGLSKFLKLPKAPQSPDGVLEAGAPEGPVRLPTAS